MLGLDKSRGHRGRHVIRTNMCARARVCKKIHGFRENVGVEQISYARAPWTSVVLADCEGSISVTMTFAIAQRESLAGIDV